MADSIRISDNPAELDRARVHAWILEQSYWANDRAAAVQDAAIDGSWNFGAYDSVTGEQLGYTRVVTDRATFAWLCDVFVDTGARGRGVGTSLVERAVSELDRLGVARIMLATADAHGLYAKFGFAQIDPPERWMSRVRTRTEPEGSR